MESSTILTIIWIEKIRKSRDIQFQLLRDRTSSLRALISMLDLIKYNLLTLTTITAILMNF